MTPREQLWRDVCVAAINAPGEVSPDDVAVYADAVVAHYDMRFGVKVVEEPVKLVWPKEYTWDWDGNNPGVVGATKDGRFRVTKEYSERRPVQYVIDEIAAELAKLVEGAK